MISPSQLKHRAGAAKNRAVVRARRPLDTPARADRPPELTGIDGHYGHTRDQVFAVYALRDVRWLFSPEAWHAKVVDRKAVADSGLAGRTGRLRISQRPNDPVGWEAEMRRDNPYPLPVVPGAYTWDDYLADGRGYLADKTGRVIQLAVDLGRTPGPGRTLPDEILEAEQKVFEHLSGAATKARRVTGPEVAWMVHRSTGLGLPAPVIPHWADRWQASAIGALSDTRWSARPFGRTVKLEGWRDGHLLTRYVAVLSLALIEAHEFPAPGRTPWLKFAQDLDFPVEVCASVQFKTKDEGVPEATRWMDRANGIDEHFTVDHGETPPPHVAREIRKAARVTDEILTGTPDRAVRAHAVVRFAVHADTEAAAQANARALIQAYSEQLHMWVEHTGRQPVVLRDFTYGNPTADPDRFKQQMPLRVWAAAVPNASNRVGTPTGPVIGRTLGANPTVVFHDGHYPMEKLNQSGFTGVIAGLGSGKSTLLGLRAIQSGIAGNTVGLLDGSEEERLAPIVHLPELASALPLHLSLSNPNVGVFRPYGLIQEPVYGDYGSEKEWREACLEAETDRRELACDAVLSLFSYKARSADFETNIQLAVERAPAGADASLWDVVDKLKKLDARNGELLEALGRGSARFMFGPRGHTVPLPDGTFTLITTGGTELPEPGSNPADWGPAVRHGLCKYNLGAHYLTGLAYGRRARPRKTLPMDEVRLFEYWSSGQKLVKKVGFNGRGSDIEGLFAGQDPRHLTSLHVAAFAGCFFLGRHADPAVARESREAAGLPADAGIEERLLTLKTAQFIYVDAYRRVHDIQIEIPQASWLAALRTTPTGLAVAS